MPVTFTDPGKYVDIPNVGIKMFYGPVCFFNLLKYLLSVLLGYAFISLLQVCGTYMTIDTILFIFAYVSDPAHLYLFSSQTRSIKCSFQITLLNVVCG